MHEQQENVYLKRILLLT